MGFIDNFRVLVPKDINVNQIKEKMKYYGYPGVKILRKINKNHLNYQHNLANFAGQIYEAYIYEILIEWAMKNTDIKKFLLKGPYITTNKHTSTGMGYDENRLVYFSFDEQIAEFDGMFFYENKLIFIEITITTYSPNLNDFVYDIKKKTKLLTKLFNDLEIYSLVITPKKINNQKYKKLTNNINWVIPNLKEIEPLIFTLQASEKKINSVKSEKYIKADELKTNDLQINKRRLLLYKKFNRLIDYSITKSEFLEEYANHWWCINRIYLGIITNENLKEFVADKKIKSIEIHRKSNKIKHAVLGIKFEQNSKPIIELYLIPKNENIPKLDTFYWANNTLKKRKSIIKKSTIMRIKKPIINLNDNEYWSKITDLSECLDILEYN